MISSPDGEVVQEISQTIGPATNNVAEYRAVLAGLERARELGATEVQLIGDSELVARQLGGTYKVKHPMMKTLHRQALDLLRGLRGGASAPSPGLRTPTPTRWSTRPWMRPDGTFLIVRCRRLEHRIPRFPGVLAR